MEEVDKSIKESLVQTSFLLSKTLHKELKKIALREDRDMRDILIEQIEKYIKVHGEGNPVYQLEKWQDSNFKSIPAHFSSSKIIHDYFMKCSDNEFNDHKFKLCEWLDAFKKRYGELPI